MKYVFRIVILLLAGMIFAASVEPVSHTDWANGIRVLVREHRARRMAQARGNESASAARVPEATGRRAGDSARTESRPGDPSQASSRKGPMAKAPNLSLSSLAEAGTFLVQVGIPCLLTVLATALIRRKRPTRSGKTE